jgi:hypothetical protein
MGIFLQLDSAEFTDEEKIQAIRKIADLPTHNGFTKDMLPAAIRYLIRGDDISQIKSNLEKIRAQIRAIDTGNAESLQINLTGGLG